MKLKTNVGAGIKDSYMNFLVLEELGKYDASDPPPP